MAKYDQGGGCACGLHKVCDCRSAQPKILIDGERRPAPLRRQLWCDMDGVLADFDTGYRNRFGRVRERHSGWDDIRATPGFFRDLPPMADMRTLWDGIKHVRPIILTGTPRSVNFAGNDKIDWAHDHLGTSVPVVCCPAKEKRFYAMQSDVLIDDSAEYRKLWEAEGGIWVQHESAVDTLAQLKALGVI